MKNIYEIQDIPEYTRDDEIQLKVQTLLRKDYSNLSIIQTLQLQGYGYIEIKDNLKAIKDQRKKIKPLDVVYETLVRKYGKKFGSSIKIN